MSRVDPQWIRGPVDGIAIEQGCTFDEAAGQFVCDFIEAFCRQSKGKWAGQPLVLLDWQRDFLMRLFGWKRDDGLRRYRRAYLEVAKKNGKSTLISALTIFLLIADGEGAPEVYVNACDRKQASIVFDEAARMVNASPELKKRLRVTNSTKTIVDPVGYGKAMANSKEVSAKDGLNPSAIIFDELHRQADRALWDIFEYAAISRSQPLTISITTAGEAEEGVWFEQRDYSERVNRGEIPDPTHLGVVYRPPADADIDDRATWYAANPSMGVTLREEDFARDLEEAKRVPTKLANFKRLRLNIVTRSEGKFLAPGQWEACARGPIDLADYRGQPCWAGLDLSSINDLTALALLFGNPTDGFDCLVKFWLPEENIVALEHEHGQPYRTWADAGYITLTPGNVIDYGAIRAELVALTAELELKKLYIDPYNATKLALELKEEDGLPIEFIRQGYLSLSAPTKELLRLILARLLRHDGNPVQRWHAGNAVAEQDAAGNIKLSKRKSRQKIDGMSALVDATAAATSEVLAGPSVYESRGVLYL